MQPLMNCHFDVCTTFVDRFTLTNYPKTDKIWRLGTVCLRNYFSLDNLFEARGNDHFRHYPVLDRFFVATRNGPLGPVPRNYLKLAQLHERVSSLNNTDHELVKETLAQFFHKLSRSAHTDHTQWLDSLEVVLTRFPKNCVVHRNVIDSYITQFLNSDNELWVIAAAKCCHSVQQVRATNEKTGAARAGWRRLMSQLCAAAHELAGAAFPDTLDVYRATGYFQRAEQAESAVQSTPVGAALADVTDFSGQRGALLSPALKNKLLCRRLDNVLTFLQAMLVEPFPVAKPVRPQLILEVVVRVLGVTSGVTLATGDSVAQVKTRALRTLDALIACLGCNLIGYSPLVLRLLTQTLRWSSAHPGPHSRLVRRSCYGTVSQWLVTLQCHRLDEALQQELLTHLLEDIEPRMHTVQLTMSNQSMKNLSKKAKRRLTNNMLTQSTIAGHIPGERSQELMTEEDPDVIVAALKCLEVLLVACGIFLKPAVHKRVQECVVRACYTLESWCEGARGLALCRVLEACRVCVSSTVAPPTQYCLHIYTKLATSKHVQLAEFCSGAALSVRQALHAAPATLTYPPPTPPLPPPSQRNRAALVALLGEERVPSPREPNEVIVVDDSMSRERNSDVEGISVSSQSLDAVEIDESNDIDLDSPLISPEESTGDSVPQPALSDCQLKLSDLNEKNKEHKIHELATQLPNTTRTQRDETPRDTTPRVHGDSDDSVEISYDHSDNKAVKLSSLEKLDGDNLPSTADTDDVQITCGQTAKSSQDSVESVADSTGRTDEGQQTETVVKANKLVGDGTSKVETEALLVADSTVRDEGVSVEDMMADFVDEKA